MPQPGFYTLWLKFLCSCGMRTIAVSATSFDLSLGSSPMSTMAMNETSWFSLQVQAEHRAAPGRPYLPPGYHSSDLLYRCLAALEVSVLDIALDVAPGGGPAVKSLTGEMLGF